jgi:hypothetical protein
MVTTLRFGRIETTMLLVCGEQNPSDEDWSEWIDAYTNAAVEDGVRNLLVLSRGGGPNARQRKQLIATMVNGVNDEVDRFRTAVCGDAAAVRVITSAIGWLSGAPHMKSFGYEEREKALRYLGTPEEDWRDVIATVKRLELDLDGRKRNGH